MDKRAWAVIVVLVVVLASTAGCYRRPWPCNPATDRAGCSIDIAH